MRVRRVGHGTGFELERVDGTRQDVSLDLVRYPIDEGYRARQVAKEGTLAQRIGVEIRLTRLARGLSAAAVARALRMARQNYSRVEFGKHLPSVAMLVEVSSLLDVSLDSLTRRAGFPRREPKAA